MSLDMQAMNDILGRYPAEREQLIQVLQDAHEAYNYLPREVLFEVAGGLDVPISEVYRVATFYAAFSLEPRGKHILKLCEGTACHVRGAEAVGDEFKRQLELPAAGGTTADMAFTFEGVNCVGACALGPVVVADEAYHGKLRSKDVTKILRQIRKADAAAAEGN